MVAVPALAVALDAREKAVPAHAAWALGRLGGRRAREALLAKVSCEPGEVARREMVEALAVI